MTRRYNSIASANDQYGRSEPHSVLVGEMFDYTGEGGLSHPRKRTIVTTKSIYGLANDTLDSDFNTRAIASWDSIFRPVSLTGSGGLPRFYQLDESVINDNKEFDPSNISQRFLNFLANPLTGIVEANPPQQLYNLHEGTGSGHDIEIVARHDILHYTGHITGENDYANIILTQNIRNNVVKTDYANDYRFFALRGPLVVHGWGYDTNGKPMPNAADTVEDTSEGIFTKEDLEDKFLDNFMEMPQTWPVAPVDLRFNRDRGVWEAGGGGGNALHEHIIVSDLSGYRWTHNTFSNNSVKALPIVWNASIKYYDPMRPDFDDLFPVDGVAVELNNFQCCSSNLVPDGIRITSPVTSKGNLIYDIDDLGGLLIVSGTGVAKNATIQIQISQGASALPVIEGINNRDGTWTSDPVDLSLYYGPGVLKIAATDGATIDEIAIEYQGSNPIETINLGGGIPIPPDLAAGSDSGRNSDNITTIREDTEFVITLDSSALQDATGPKPFIYVDGVRVTSGWNISLDYGFFDDSRSVAISNSSIFALGVHSIQVQMVYDDASTERRGPISDPLYVTFVEEDEVEPEYIYGLTATSYQDGGEFRTVRVGSCPVKLLNIIKKKLGGSPIYRGVCSNTFSVDGTATIPATSLEVAVPSDVTAPTLPSSGTLNFLQPTGEFDPRVSAVANSWIYGYKEGSNYYMTDATPSGLY